MYPTSLHEAQRVTRPLELSPLHKHMCALKAAGLRGVEIAEVVGMSQSQVSLVLSHPDAEALVARLTTDLVARTAEDTAALIQGATHEAMLLNIKMMREGQSEVVRQRSIFDILDRGGFKPKEVVVSATLQMDKDEVAALRETLHQARGEVPVRPAVDNAVRMLTEGEEPRIGSGDLLGNLPDEEEAA